MIITLSIIGQFKRCRWQSVARNILNKAILVLHSIKTFQIVWNVCLVLWRLQNNSAGGGGAGGANQILYRQKGVGAEKVLAILKGAHKALK